MAWRWIAQGGLTFLLIVAALAALDGPGLLVVALVGGASPGASRLVVRLVEGRR